MSRFPKRTPRRGGGFRRRRTWCSRRRNARRGIKRARPRGQLLIRQPVSQRRSMAPAQIRPPRMQQEWDPSTAAQIARWDRDLAALLERERQRSRELTVLVPETLPVTRAQALVADPRRFALNLRRPMPRPSAAQARLGTRFHEWVAARWSQHPLIDALDWSADAELAGGAADTGVGGLAEGFRGVRIRGAGTFAIEYPFTITLAGSPVSGQDRRHLCRGRRLGGRRLEDQHHPRRGSAAAGDLPDRLGSNWLVCRCRRWRPSF